MAGKVNSSLTSPLDSIRRRFISEIMSTYNNLNFPEALKIEPSVKKGDHVDTVFATSNRQMEAIEKYGIAGGWCCS